MISKRLPNSTICDAPLQTGVNWNLMIDLSQQTLMNSFHKINKQYYTNFTLHPMLNVAYIQ